MAKIVPSRLAAEIDDGAVVFLIGMRVNRFWQVHRWLPVAMAMPSMLRELARDPALGLLGYQMWVGPRGPMLVQYWRSQEHLNRFARDPALTHRPAWLKFYRQVGLSGKVGIWHEMYPIASYESTYVNMPRFGLAAAGRAVAQGSSSAQSSSGT